MAAKDAWRTPRIAPHTPGRQGDDDDDAGGGQRGQIPSAPTRTRRPTRSTPSRVTSRRPRRAAKTAPTRSEDLGSGTSTSKSSGSKGSACVVSPSPPTPPSTYTTMLRPRVSGGSMGEKDGSAARSPLLRHRRPRRRLLTPPKLTADASPPRAPRAGGTTINLGGSGPSAVLGVFVGQDALHRRDRRRRAPKVTVAHPLPVKGVNLLTATVANVMPAQGQSRGHVHLQRSRL